MIRFILILLPFLFLLVSCGNPSDKGDSSPELDCSEIINPDQYLNPNIKYDTLIDSRDGNSYATIAMGGTVWFAQNLRYNGDSKHPLYPNKCPLDNFAYSWNLAVGPDSIHLTLDRDSVQGICPEGWHLPSMQDWKNLQNYIQAYISKSGTDTSLQYYEGGFLVSKTTGIDHWDENPDNQGNPLGFSIFPTDHVYHGGSNIDSLILAPFWSSTSLTYPNAVSYNLYVYPDFQWQMGWTKSRILTYLNDGFSRLRANPVRCVKHLVP